MGAQETSLDTTVLQALVIMSLDRPLALFSDVIV